MKVKEIYNLDSYKAIDGHIASHLNKTFKDTAYAGLVLSRNLEYVDPTIFEKKYPEAVFMNSGVTIDNTGGYADTITSLRINGQGSFAESGDSSSDKGKISIYGEDSSIKTRQKEAFSEWTNTDMRKALLQNIPLASTLFQTTNQIYVRELDSIGFLGIGTHKGLLNYAGFNTTAAAGVVTGLTSQAMYDEISDLILLQWDSVSNTPEYMANKCTMPTTVFNHYQKEMLNTASGSSTVLKALRDNYPSVDFNSSFRANSPSKTVAYSTGADVMKFRLPKPLEVSEIVKVTGTRHRVDYDYIVGGLDVLVDEGAQILTGL
jgi:hypothetical protein